MLPSMSDNRQVGQTWTTHKIYTNIPENTETKETFDGFPFFKIWLLFSFPQEAVRRILVNTCIEILRLHLKYETNKRFPISKRKSTDQTCCLIRVLYVAILRLWHWKVDRTSCP